MKQRVDLRGRIVTDHRGREWPVHWPKKLRRFKEELPADTARQVAVNVSRHYFGRWRWRGIVLFASVAGLSKLYMVAAIGPQGVAGRAGMYMSLLYGLMLGLIVAAALALERAYARRRVANSLLAFNHCPRCLYSLNGLPQEGDGCTICPECGAAWRSGATTPHSSTPR